MKKILLLMAFVFVFLLTSCSPDDVYVSTSETTTTQSTTTETTTAPGITDGGVYTESETGEWEYLG